MIRLPFLRRERAIPEGVREEDVRTVETFVEAFHGTLQRRLWGWESSSRTVAQSDPAVYARVTGVKGEDRGRMALALLHVARGLRDGDYGSRDYWVRGELYNVAGRLAATRGAFAPEDFPAFVEGWRLGERHGVGYARLAGAAEEVVAAHGLTPEIAAALRPVLAEMAEPKYEWDTPTADERRVILRLRALLEPENAAARALPEPWQAPFRDPRWKALVEHAASARSNVPTARWMKAAQGLVADPGPFLAAFEEAVDAVGRMPGVVDAIHSDTLRGLAWTAGLTGLPRAASLLERLVVASAHKIPNFGARSPKGFSGAVGALERMGTFESLAALSNARNRVKVATLNAAVTAALARAAEGQATPLADLEEIVVPTYGLELPGVRTEAQDDVEARLEIVGATDVALRWSRAGRELKAPPAEAKELAKQVKAAKKEIEATLAAQRARIEGLMPSGRTVPYPQWRERYLDHPLLAHMVRRLVWRFADADGERLGIAPDGTPLDAEGQPLPVGESTTVRLWHPLQAGVAAVEAWRDFLVAREIRQPFKQAYREVYLLTAAEERTATYSNRFAAHVLKQHQMVALARGRGWRAALQGFFDGGYGNPTLDLPTWGLRAEYFVEIAEVPDGGETDSGIARYVATDQVRFNDIQTGAAVPLAEVPPLVFSEVMRDVDLFVGVASVGNDPEWRDQGERAGYGGYWRQVSFGDLSASAETRRAVLERLLPRLAIGRVSRLEGRFLVVRGKRRTYKIHLGSGNILMEPNDQYLCIVPGGKAPNERVYLPFEGDGVLAIILSKAAMLMDDDRITDRTILRQL